MEQSGMEKPKQGWSAKQKWLMVGSAVGILCIGGVIGGLIVSHHSAQQAQQTMQANVNGQSDGGQKVTAPAPTASTVPPIGTTDPNGTGSPQPPSASDVTAQTVGSTTLADNTSGVPQTVEQKLRAIYQAAANGRVPGIDFAVDANIDDIIKAYGRPVTSKLDFMYYDNGYAGYSKVGFLFDAPDYKRVFAIQIYDPNLIGKVTPTQIEHILGAPTSAIEMYNDEMFQIEYDLGSYMLLFFTKNHDTPVSFIQVGQGI